MPSDRNRATSKWRSTRARRSCTEACASAVRVLSLGGNGAQHGEMTDAGIVHIQLAGVPSSLELIGSHPEHRRGVPVEELACLLRRQPGEREADAAEQRTLPVRIAHIGVIDCGRGLAPLIADRPISGSAGNLEIPTAIAKRRQDSRLVIRSETPLDEEIAHLGEVIVPQRIGFEVPKRHDLILSRIVGNRAGRNARSNPHRVVSAYIFKNP